MPSCPKCSSRRYTSGSRCPLCGHLAGDPAEKPEPERPDPTGPDREFCCRYCSRVFPSARACQEHQAVRHAGVGLRLVTDVDP